MRPDDRETSCTSPRRACCRHFATVSHRLVWAKAHLRVLTLYMSSVVATPRMVSARARSRLMTRGKMPIQIVTTGITACRCTVSGTSQMEKSYIGQVSVAGRGLRTLEEGGGYAAHNVAVHGRAVQQAHRPGKLAGQQRAVLAGVDQLEVAFGPPAPLLHCVPDLHGRVLAT